MSELLRPQGIQEDKITRRKFLEVCGAGGLLLLAESAGIDLLTPPLKGRPIKAEELTGWWLANVVLDKDFFLNTDPLIYGHRLGNQGIEKINKAYELGVNVFDIDVNDMSERIEGGNVLDRVYAAHGLIVHNKNNIIGEIDPAELKIKFGEPLTVVQAIHHIASLSTPEHRLGLTLDLKNYGPLKRKTLEALFNSVYDIIPTVFIPNGHRPELKEMLAERDNKAL